jgi:hypothetical protein
MLSRAQVEIRETEEGLGFQRRGMYALQRFGVRGQLQHARGAQLGRVEAGATVLTTWGRPDDDVGIERPRT